MLDFKNSVDFIDKLFKFFPESDPFNISDVIERSDLSPAEKILAEGNNTRLEKVLINDLKYAEADPNRDPDIKLLPLGVAVKKAGGHFAYLEKLAEKEIAEKKRQEQKDRTEDIDFKHKRWTHKARYTPYIFSTLALIGTGISIFISIQALNYKKDQSDLREMRQEIQQLKSEMNKSNPSFSVDTLLVKHKK